MYEKFIRPALTLLAVAWLVVVFFDYFRFTANLDPMFCIKKETHQYNDGKVWECNGAGYTVFKYDRKSLKMEEFGIIYFTKERQPEE